MASFDSDRHIQRVYLRGDDFLLDRENKSALYKKTSRRSWHTDDLIFMNSYLAVL